MFMAPLRSWPDPEPCGASFSELISLATSRSPQCAFQDLGTGPPAESGNTAQGDTVLASQCSPPFIFVAKLLSLEGNEVMQACKQVPLQCLSAGEEARLQTQASFAESTQEEPESFQPL